MAIKSFLTPTLYTLKTWWPEARLRVVSKYDVGHYYTDLPWVDEFVRVTTFLDYLEAQPKSDCVSVCLHHSSERYGLVNLLRRPKMRLGFKHGRFTDFVWTHSYRKSGLEYIGLANLKMLSKVRPVNAPAAIRQCFETVALPAYDRTRPAEVIFIPGGGSGEFKRWSWRHYVRLAELLKRHLACSTTFTFMLGPSERRELEELRTLDRRDFRLEFGRSSPSLPG